MGKRVLVVATTNHDHNQAFVVIRRRKTGLWELPGGRIDAGESSKTAAARETHEEIGASVYHLTKVADTSITRVKKNKKGKKKGKKKTLKVKVYTTKVTLSDIYVSEPRVFDDIRVVTKNDLAHLPLAASLDAIKTHI